MSGPPAAVVFVGTGRAAMVTGRMLSCWLLFSQRFIRWRRAFSDKPSASVMLCQLQPPSRSERVVSMIWRRSSGG